jgi:molecular chaperone GrpE
MTKKETAGNNIKDDEKSEHVTDDVTETDSSGVNVTGNESGESETLLETGKKGVSGGKGAPDEEDLSDETEVTEEKEDSEEIEVNVKTEVSEGAKDHKHRKHSREKELETKLNEQHDKYLRLSAEFDNYRKRMLKERIELTQYISADIYTKILPIIDDFERAMATIRQTEEIDPVRQGVELIYNKFKEHLNQQGIKEIDALNHEFNTDFHDAVSRFPVEDVDLKGKVIDVIEKGYMLNDRVIRFCKVVVGE